MLPDVQSFSCQQFWRRELLIGKQLRQVAENLMNEVLDNEISKTKKYKQIQDTNDNPKWLTVGYDTLLQIQREKKLQNMSVPIITGDHQKQWKPMELLIFLRSSITYSHLSKVYAEAIMANDDSLMRAILSHKMTNKKKGQLPDKIIELLTHLACRSDA